MKVNPVYRLEAAVRERSAKTAFVLLVFNGILSGVALLNLYSAMVQTRLTARMQYTSFMDLFFFAAVLEFLMLVLIMPAVTAGSISGERERQTFDLLLAAGLTPAQIVLGKLMAALGTMLLLVVTSLPILALIFVYGGITLTDLLTVFACLAAAAFLAGSLGICCSAYAANSTLSAVAAFAVLGLLTAGSFGACLFVSYLRTMQLGLSPADGLAADAGALGTLLLFNPAATLFQTIGQMSGRGRFFSGLGEWLALQLPAAVRPCALPLGIGLQLALSAGLLRLAVRRIADRR